VELTLSIPRRCLTSLDATPCLIVDKIVGRD
jgi:hypothetical protein